MRSTPKYLAIALLLWMPLCAADQNDREVDILYDRIEQHDAKAYDALVALGKKQDAQALAALGFIQEHGVTVPKNIPAAIRYYAQACELGGDYGCGNAAYFYDYGIGVAKDPDQARHYDRLLNMDGIDKTYAAELKKDFRLAYDIKASAEADATRRPELIENASYLAGSGDSEMRLMAERSGFSKSHTLWLARLWAQGGDPTLNFLVGHFYNFGWSYVDKENLEALKWFRRAAQAGDADSQNILGQLYLNGEWGIQADPQSGMHWFELSAAQGNRDALVNLGDIYYQGESVRVDYAKAHTLYQQAVTRGSSSAASQLSWMYYNGQGVQVDCDKALQYRQMRYGANPSKDPRFLSTCKLDQASRKRAAQTQPILTLRHKSTFLGGNEVACEPHFSVSTNQIGEIANLRITIEFQNDKGATSQRIVAFAPFGLNTMNEKNGHDVNSFEGSALVPMQTDDFCHRDMQYRIKAATATVNRWNQDLLATGILKQ
ncbi:SEL1-like repeat protein [Achromobacter sp. DH1f]|uniref:SEL1-like repeat protein n=1 Tax=Achromobacter sp. DH1f TaxID=1397275 RepID=UPI0004A80FF4|nr:SEL1-like repeat protein [Achromobacter sp. DH1f]